MAKEKIAPSSFSGYLQSKKTSEGFEKMKRRGVVLPPFQIEQNAAMMIRHDLYELIAAFEAEMVSASKHVGVAIADSLPLTEILIENLKKRLVEMKNSEETEANKRYKKKLERQLQEAQEEFFKDFLEDSSREVGSQVDAALNRDDVFSDRLEGIRRGYLDESIDRINGGKSDLRKHFIAMLDNWINGNRDELTGLDDIMAKIKKESLVFSKYFARDQFSRFNKALTIASYEEANVKYVRWVTVGDARVRRTRVTKKGKVYPGHRELHGKIFRIDDLPSQINDYLCRCAFIPVLKLNGQKVSRGDGIALTGARMAA